MDTNNVNHRALLTQIAHQAMLERGLLPDFSAAVLHEVDRLNGPARESDGAVRDLRRLPWASIDNDDSRDLDQLTAAEALGDGRVRVLVAVADVDALVKDDSAIDGHARHNTTSVYTAAAIFPMLPEKLSTDLTSLNPGQDRLAIVIEMLVDAQGNLIESDIYRATVHNHAQLAYNSVTEWLEGNGEFPGPSGPSEGLPENLRLQAEVARRLRDLRHARGALSFETIEARPLFEDDQVRSLELAQKNRAREIIEDFMIAANGAVARFLTAKDFPCIRRVVHTPKRWDRIVELAAEHGYQLPDEPEPLALEKFLNQQRIADPLRFPDLSLAVIKLLGAGEYVVDYPGDEISLGHFGLAVQDYTHSTAPNRRYTDLITHRLLKAALDGKPAPYRTDELESLARHCTEEEDEAYKVERQVGKAAVALLLQARIGEKFNAIVTGASEKGTWVRLLEVPVEGKLVKGYKGVDVGQRVRVELIYVDVERGYIDFKKVKR